MNMNEFIAAEGEKPLDRIVTDGGFCGIFRTIACVGDSLSSGCFDGTAKDGSTKGTKMLDYSWGQYLARMTGSKVYNFSTGGMTAKAYCTNFAQANGFWEKEKAAQAYIIALGHNDLYGRNMEVGCLDDVKEDYKLNSDNIAGYYAQIIQRYKEIQPNAKFFLVTLPYDTRKDEIWRPRGDAHRKLLYELAEHFSNCYVIDLRQYLPEYDEEFRRLFYMGGHMSATGYIFTAKVMASYIDYIIRHNPDDFKNVCFIGSEYEDELQM